MLTTVGSRDCRRLGALGSLLLTACPGPAFVVDGWAVDEAQWKADRTTVVMRATQELSCPKENLSLTLLDAKEMYLGGDATFRVATRMGASGCGRRAVYSRTREGWIVSDPARESKPPA